MSKPNWYYKGKEIKGIEDIPEGVESFVYLIYFKEEGVSYIGKKNLYSTRKRKFGKRKVAAMEDKRCKMYEKITTESNWKIYTSSSKEVARRIEEGQEYMKDIIYYATHKAQLTYLEVKAMFELDALEDESFLNDNILGKFYRKNII